MARCLPLVAGPSLITVMTLVLGTASSAQLAYFVVACWPFQLFDTEQEPRPLVTLVALPLGAYVFAETSGLFPVAVDLSAATLEILRLAFVSTLSAIFGLTLWYFYRGNQRNENALASSLVDLELARAHAQDSNRAKTEFLALMSHELRTPLHGVLGAAELLRSTALDSDQQELVLTVHTSAEHLSRQIGRVWQMVKLDRTSIAPKSRVDEQAFSAIEWSQEILEEFRSAAKSKGVELQLETDLHSGDSKLEGDCEILGQVTREVLSNAIRFTDNGQVLLGLSLEKLANGDLCLQLRVSDTGCGIPNGLQDKVFEPFACAGPVKNHGHEGLGLGLALCRRLIRSLRGDMDLSSSAGGTVVRFQCPVVVSKLAPPESSTQPSIESAVTEKKSNRALLVDDNKVNRMILGRMLKSLGYEVVTANDGQFGVEAEASQCFDVVLMDIQMPRMDGLEAIATIRRREASLAMQDPPESRHVPIVVITANASDEQRATARRLGVEGYLIKPCKRPEIQQAVEAARLQPVAETA